MDASTRDSAQERENGVEPTQVPATVEDAPEGFIYVQGSREAIAHIFHSGYGQILKTWCGRERKARAAVVAEERIAENVCLQCLAANAIQPTQVPPEQSDARLRALFVLIFHEAGVDLGSTVTLDEKIIGKLIGGLRVLSLAIRPIVNRW